MILIGITGRCESGKSTVSKAIAKEAKSHGLKAEIFELSNYVLREAIGMSTIPPKERSELTNSEIEELVRLGSQRREENPRHWIELMLADIEEKRPYVGVVPNIRFLNEAEAIRSMGGSIIRIRSFVVDGVEWVSRSRDPNHPSETEHHFIRADYFLTALRGESILLGKQAATLFNYLVERQTNAN